MAQNISGLRSILSIAFFYDLLQSVLGSNKLRNIFVEEYVKIKSGDRVLDIGCGTAQIIKYFPENIEYVGFDASEQYINVAKKKYADRNAQFFAKLVTDEDIDGFEKFDIILAVGLLHHLEDDEALHLFSLAKNFMKRGGRLITIDLCLIENQRKTSKFLIKRDRGQNRRKPAEYLQLAKKILPNSRVFLRNDLLHIPYDHAILECEL